MIYSNKHNYIFLEVPNTGSTAISAELRTNYAGASVSNKHAFLAKARNILGEDVVENAFKFCTVRNPLDAWVSRYEKLRHNHKENFTTRDRRKSQGGWVPDAQVEMFDFVAAGATFKDFVLRYPKSYKTNTIYMARASDFIMRFETLAEDFRTCLVRMGIEPLRPLPQANQTKGKGKFLDYYDEETLDVAKRELGSFMDELGYQYPELPAREKGKANW